jgi:hypothetical protein
MKAAAKEPVPAGVRAIAALTAASGLYLGCVGALMLLRPGMVSMAAGAPLLFGLETAGPYLFLLAGVIGGIIAWGLMQRNNIARHAAILIAIAGVVMLVPTVSGAVVMVNAKAIAIDGFGIIVRVMVAWYLSRGEIAEQFHWF